MSGVLELVGDSFDPDANTRLSDDSDPCIGNEFVGKAGEFVASAALAELGVAVHHNPGRGYDLVCETGGEFYRVQVKTNGKAGLSTYPFHVLKEHGRHKAVQNRVKRELDRRDCDIVALVSLAKRRAIFLPVERCQDRYLSVTAAEFDDPATEGRSWLTCLA